MKAFLITILLGLTIPFYVYAEKSAGQIADECAAFNKIDSGDDSSLSKAKVVSCMSYMDGYYEGITQYIVKTGGEPLFCIPKNINNKSQAIMFVEYMKKNANAKYRRFSAYLLMYEFFKESFPCN